MKFGMFASNALAAAIGWDKHHEVLWTIFDATTGPFYLVYRIITHFV
jgi:hypothetical protein